MTVRTIVLAYLLIFFGIFSFADEGKTDIRPLDSTDIDAVIGLNQKSPHPVPDWKLLDSFGKHENYCLVAVKNGEIIGFTHYEVKPEAFIVDQVVVKPGHSIPETEELLLFYLKDAFDDLPHTELIARISPGDPAVKMFKEYSFKDSGNEPPPGVPAGSLILHKKSYPVRVHVRPMNKKDIPTVVGIEKLATGETWAPDHYYDSFMALREMISIVFEDPAGNIVGAYMYSVAGTTVTLVRFAVSPDFQDKGVPEQMVERLKKALSPRNKRKEITVEIPEQEGTKTVLLAGGFQEDHRRLEEGEKPSHLVYQFELPKIRRQLQARTPFERLGVGLGATPKQIQSKVHALENVYVLSANERSVLENSAETLSDPLLRRHYLADNRELLKASLPPTRLNPGAKNLYELLGLTPDASDGDISGALEGANVFYHDKPELMAHFTRAARILLDKTSREFYDAIESSLDAGADKNQALQRFFRDHYRQGDPATQLPARKAARKPSKDREREESPSHPYNRPDPDSLNLYQRLGVPENNASLKTIGDAYTEAMIDFKGNKKAQQKLLEAKVILMGPLRDKYKEFLWNNPTATDRQAGKAIAGLYQEAAKFVPRPESDNLYQRLGLPSDATDQDIFDAFSAVSATLKTKPVEFDRVLFAFRVLRDPSTRPLYDELEKGSDRKKKTWFLNGLQEEFRAKASADRESEPTGLEPAVIKADPESADLYVRLGVPWHASWETIEKAFFMAWPDATPAHRQLLMEAFSILKDGTTRAEYDRGLHSIPLLFAQAQRHEELERVSRLIDETDEQESVSVFWSKTKNLTDTLYSAPEIAEWYLDAIRDKIQVVPKDSPVETFKPAIEVLETLKGLSDGKMRSAQLTPFREKLLELRGRLAEKVIRAANRDPHSLQVAHSFYPALKAGDLVKHLFQSAENHGACAFGDLDEATGL